MAEWLVERGVGEDRALLLDAGTVLAAKLRWPDEPYAGKAVRLTLASKPAGARRGIARDVDGIDYVVDRLPADLTEGREFDAIVTRAAIAESGRLKRPQARVGASTCDDVFSTARQVRAFTAGLWEDVWETAASGAVAFPGGSLLLSPTPAMTLVDIDGTKPPRELALAAIPAIASALRQLDIGGSVGIDFPTIEAKPDRRAVDDALADALADIPHERTAINGFGFVQIVMRLDGPSLLHRLAFRRRDAAIRMALRRAERVEGAGVTLLTIAPALEPLLRPEWHGEVERRTGRPLRIATDPSLATIGSAAQIVAA